jgi:hypothetical protein
MTGGVDGGCFDWPSPIHRLTGVRLLPCHEIGRDETNKKWTLTAYIYGRIVVQKEGKKKKRKRKMASRGRLASGVCVAVGVSEPFPADSLIGVSGKGESEQDKFPLTSSISKKPSSAFCQPAAYHLGEELTFCWSCMTSGRFCTIDR